MIDSKWKLGDLVQVRGQAECYHGTVVDFDRYPNSKLPYPDTVVVCRKGYNSETNTGQEFHCSANQLEPMSKEFIKKEKELVKNIDDIFVPGNIVETTLKNNLFKVKILEPKRKESHIFTGEVIETTSGIRKVGDYSDNWLKECFVLFEGAKTEAASRPQTKVFGTYGANTGPIRPVQYATCLQYDNLKHSAADFNRKFIIKSKNLNGSYYYCKGCNAESAPNGSAAGLVHKYDCAVAHQIGGLVEEKKPVSLGLVYRGFNGQKNYE